MTFEKLLKKHCTKDNIKMYFDRHKTLDIYRHECNLYFVLGDNAVAVYNLSSPFECIYNTDWLFSFTNERHLNMFLTSLTINCT
jgi:hypothetical protein